MDSNKVNWLEYWDQRGLSDVNKIANGRGSYPNEIYEEIYKDIINKLNINNLSSILDVGGGNGYFIKQIYKECKPKNTHLLEQSINHVNKFQSWINDNNITNIKVSQYILPSLPNNNEKYNKIMCGTTLGYLKDYTEIKECIKKMYNILEDNGDLLIFHHHQKSNDSVLTLNMEKILDLIKGMNFGSIIETSIGPFWGDGCCGKNEFSVLLKNKNGLR